MKTNTKQFYEFKLGDIVICIPGFTTNDAGLGYKPGKRFVINEKISVFNNQHIYYPKEDNGVFEFALRKIDFLEEALLNIKKEIGINDL
jgi:hypothetical protein